MNILKLLTYITTVSLVFACEKVIDIDLENAEAQIVIEAELKAGNHPFEVKISKSKAYFESEESIFIEEASVILYDANDNATELVYTQNGIYSANVNALAGVDYRLKVIAEGEEYNAISKMQQAINLTGLDVEFQEGFGPLPEGHVVYFKFSDPLAVENFYRVTHSINGAMQVKGSDLIIEDDQLFNGNDVRLSLARKAFELGDTVEVNLLHIDKNVYSYFSSLQDILGGDGGPGASAAPGNPTSNWSNDALGYFAAVNISTQTVTIQ
ncbi:MAG: DUF4249 domain-containing protein [Lishizhenia sp.]